MDAHGLAPSCNAHRRVQNCPCIARSKVYRALCRFPLYRRHGDVRVGALANNNNGKLEDEFGE